MTSGTRGRPRSERARLAVLTAARDLLFEMGYERLTIDRVAARAAVGKQTVYRWWPSKAAVVASAVLDRVIEVPHLIVADTGCLRDDLQAWLDQLTTLLQAPQAQAVIRALAVAVANDPAVGEALQGQLTGPNYDSVVTRLERAQAVGQVRHDADIRGAADVLSSFVLFFVLGRQSISLDRIRGLLRVVLTGVEPSALLNPQAGS